MQVNPEDLMLDAIPNCPHHDIQCHIQKMMVSERHPDPRCASLFRNYNTLNSKGMFFSSQTALSEALNQCESYDGAHIRNILANYYSPSGSLEEVKNSCSKLSGNGRSKIVAYLKSLGVNPMSCEAGLTNREQDKLLQNVSSCDFTCEVKVQLKKPNLNTIPGQFANQFMTYINEPDMLTKLGVFYQKKHGVSADILALRDFAHGKEMPTPVTKSLDTEVVVVEFHKGTMSLDKFNILLEGAKFAKTSTTSHAAIASDVNDENVIPYARTNDKNLDIVTLGGSALFGNKQPGLTQVFSLYGSWAIEIAKELLRSPTSLVITSDNGIYKQLKQFTDSDNLIVIKEANTDAALQVVEKLSNFAVSYDSKGQPIINANITLIGDHMFIGFLTGTIKVKTSSKNEINWRSLATNLTSKPNTNWLELKEQLSNFTRSEIRDMPGFRELMPSGLLPVFRGYVESGISAEANLPDFAHYLVGYQTYLLFTSKNTNSGCSNVLAPERTESGDYVVCL